MTDAANCSVILTGVIGSGKSCAGNFFLNKKVFVSKWSLKSVTTATASATGIVKGKHITIIDTPGFLNPLSLSKIEEFLGLAGAIVEIPNGVNAVGLLINMRNRINRDDVELLQMLLETEDMLPYAFLVFTNAIALGNNEKEQQQRIEETLKDENECPKILSSVLSKIDNRYILLESVDEMGEGYYETKSQELLDILRRIMNKNPRPYTCVVNEIAEILSQFDVASQFQEKDKLIAALAADLQTVKENSKPNMFWKNFIIYVGGGVGIGLGAATVGIGVASSSAIAAGGSKLHEYLSKHPEVAKRIVQQLLDIAKAYFLDK